MCHPSGLSLVVWAYGATLVELRVPNAAGRAENVVLRLPDLAAYESSSQYVGVTLGRYARCVSGASFRLDNAVYHLPANDPPHHIHGGHLGFDRFVWDAEAGPDGDGLCVRLRRVSPEGEQGYPGTLDAQVTYRLDADALTLEYRATTTASTVVDLTCHAFWNLTGKGEIGSHELAIDAGRVLLVDERLIPVGGPVAVDGSAFDYRAPRALRDQRLDHCFVLRGSRPAAELVDPVSGRRLRVSTDQTALQTYSGDGLPRARAGLCLQPGSWPNAPNRSDFPSARLDPGGTYVHRTRYELSTL